MAEVAAVLSRFLWVESCGQCPPCKLGTGEITAALDEIVAGRGSRESLETVNHWLDVVADGNRCFLPVEAQQMIASLLREFPADFDAHLEGTCTSTRDLDVPKIVDIDEQGARYDLRQRRKRPDWTYDPEVRAAD